ncbi:MAG: hypothetical protein WAN36_14510 [Calditrichia bacterium]
MQRINIKIIQAFLLCLLAAELAAAHGYLFSKTNEEMHETITAELAPDMLTLQYESVYLGQIAPHSRLMIDADRDSVITRQEVEAFFKFYKDSLNTALSHIPFTINGERHYLRIISLFGNKLLTDSLLAPLQFGMLFIADSLNLQPGMHEISIDPKLLFENGNLLIRQAKQKADLTNMQVNDIARYLQFSMEPAGSIELLSTYPGRLRKKDQVVNIYGVFYDETILKIQALDYPKITIKFQIRQQP